jgi:hypothetical protein
MAKKQKYYEAAEHLYVIEQNTLREISKKLPVSERTLSDWKNQGGWDKKQQRHIENKKAFHEELYMLGRKLIKSISEDLDAGKEISERRINSLARLVPQMLKAKDYEKLIETEMNEAESSDGDTNDRVVDLVNEILGIKK